MAAVAGVLAFLAGRFLFPAGPAEPGAASAALTAPAPVTWTCSMHPQIQQPDEGDCPICGMDLIPLEPENAGGGERVLSMSEGSRALADLQTSPVTRFFPETQVRLSGRLEYDETRLKSLTARFPARIETLFVNYTGIPVQRGEHLADVYSPELLNAQRELLTARRADPSSLMTASAREKLRLWGLLPEQIDSLLESGAAGDTLTLRAPIGGIVVARHVREGDYLKTGDPFFKIADLSELWLYLDAFESDLPWLHYGQDVTFTVEAFPGESFEGRIAFIEPEVDRQTRTVSIRVNVPNPDQRLKPGMFARGRVTARMGAGGTVFAPDLAGKWISPMHPEIIKDGPGSCDVCGMDLVPAEALGYTQHPDQEAPLAVPASAVLQTGQRALVYVELPESERPTYEGREVVLGPRAGEVFIVRSGLLEGEQVVTHGAFKLDSALQIQARPSLMSAETEATRPEPAAGEAGVLDISVDLAVSLMEPYLAMQAAMANDDLDGAKTHLHALMERTGHAGPLAELVHAMVESADLEAMRRPHLERLSNALIAAVRSRPEAFDQDLFLMHCPMVYGETGADWLQDNDSLRNPYFGSMMLRCGDLVEQLSERATDAHSHAR